MHPRQRDCAALVRLCVIRGRYAYWLLLPPSSPSLCSDPALCPRARSGDGIISRTEWVEFVLREVKENGEKAMLRLMQVLVKQLESMPKI